MPTPISWTNETWNPVTGCSKVSAGCRHCYAERLSLRYGWSKLPWTQENAGWNVICHPERLAKPKQFRKPTMIFVNSMSDMFHEAVPDDFIGKIFDTVMQTPQHTYQCLTKRAERLKSWHLWPRNV